MASLDVTSLVSSVYKSKLLSAKELPRSSIAEPVILHLAETSFVLLEISHVCIQLRFLLYWPRFLLKF